MNSLRAFKSVKARRKFISQKTKSNLTHTGSFTLNEEVAGRKNCENMIGATQIPLGIAGPLFIRRSLGEDGQPSTQSYYLPLATTEGALVASVNRGCKAITLSGGANVYVFKAGTTRAPVFQTQSLAQGFAVKSALVKDKPKISQIASATSSHLKLLDYEIQVLGRSLFLRFTFDTADAMGMNMSTIATAEIVKYIENKFAVRCVSLAGNYDIDKKPAWLNFIKQRGFAVWAECTISPEILKSTLKTDSSKIAEVSYRKHLLGSALAGSLGFNGHYANVVAALFLALGQDPAHVVEGSLGITTTEVLSDNKLYFSVYLPAILVGTVGGGTQLDTQKEALNILGLKGGNRGENAQKLAEIVGGAVLAGELSLTASLAQGTLATAHQKLARGE